MKKITIWLVIFAMILGFSQVVMAGNSAIELKGIVKEDFANYDVSKNTNFRDYPASKVMFRWEQDFRGNGVLHIVKWLISPECGQSFQT